MKNFLTKIWRKANRAGRSRFARLFLFFAAAFSGLAVLAGVAFYLFVIMGFFGDMPSRKELKDKRNDTASEVYSADSILLGRYFIYDRTNIGYRDIDTSVIEALVATEDARFYQHHGVDSRSLARVLVKSILLQNESSGGGSTLTQQLAKNLFPRRDYWLLDMPINKTREMVIARRLESVYTKAEILELYLNTVSFGGTIFGVERAAHYFFNTSAKKLKPEQAAVLVGMLKATTSYNPRNHPERAKKRRNIVLAQMQKYGYLTPEKTEKLQKLNLGIKKEVVAAKKQEENLAPYFREQLRAELAEWCENQVKRNGDHYNQDTDGLKKYTTIDSKMQREAERAVSRRMAALQRQFDTHWQGLMPWGKDNSVLDNAMRQSVRYKRMKAAGATEQEIAAAFQKRVSTTLYGYNGAIRRTISPMDSLAYYMKFLNTGLVAMEPETGFVRAWVGGINHGIFKYDHVTSKRQVGSTFKPIVYAAALQKGIQPCKYIENKLTTYTQYENWEPQNADNKYGGRYSLEGALSNSVNTVSAQLILKVGVPYTIRLARSMGIQSDLPPVPSLALGTADLSLLEMVGAYTAFANQGRISQPVYVTKILDRNGSALRESDDEGHREVLSPENAAIMLHMMQSVVNEGSGSSLRSTFGLSVDIAGKTGTTQNQSDGWFIGITPGLVTGVWVGGESPLVRFRSLEQGQGARTALPVWGEFTSRLVRSGYYSKKTPFEPLSDELQSRLDCAPYLEDEATFFEKVKDVLPFNFPTKEERQEKKKTRKERRAERKAERKRDSGE